MYLLFDIGGTNMRLAVSKDGKTFGEPKMIPTPADDFEEGIRRFRETAEELAGGVPFEAAAGGAAGPMDREQTMLVTAPNIAGWNGKPLKKEIENMCKAPVYLENDAALAGLGEATAGAGRGYGVAAYVTVSTGVGGVRIVDGAIDRNTSGFEIGHQIINYDGDIKTLEEYVSGSGFLKRFGKLPQDISDESVWEETARLLAVGLRNTILHWSPEVLILGGPLVLQSPLPFENLKQYLTQNVLAIFPGVPDVKKAELGDASGLYGALALLRTK